MVVSKEPSVYLLAGTEQFLKEENLARIKSVFLDRASAEFNFNVFYPAPVRRGETYSCSAEKILECVCTSPFLGRKRVVLVRRVEQFSTADKKLILSYVRTPRKQSLLVLETSQSYLGSNFLAEICKYARLIFCSPLKEKQLFSWVKAQAGAREKKIEDEALRALIDNLGNNLQLLAFAFDNLILYIGRRLRIEVEDVEKLVGPNVTATVFQLFDAVIVRDKKRSFQILSSLLKAGINSSQILGALAHKLISERGKISSALLERSLLDLQKTDSDIKTGRQGQTIALELLLVKLLS